MDPDPQGQALPQGQPLPSSRQRSYEAIERARERVASSLDRLDRSEATLRRADAHDARDERLTDGGASGFRHHDDRDDRDDRDDGDDGAGRALRGVLEARARRLHQRYAAVAFALGATESALAEEYERLALEEPEQAAEHRGRAERARRTAAALRTAEPVADQDGDADMS
ncbi:hypothetical protein ACIRPX_26765 [Streptomyces sp. NPDC101225]|uniref:hypothetical protein n=1 Tax=Streptomyces sp. NPDC101225 TaxID=3366135 RepID=UPI0037F70031